MLTYIFKSVISMNAWTTLQNSSTSVPKHFIYRGYTLNKTFVVGDDGVDLICCSQQHGINQNFGQLKVNITTILVYPSFYGLKVHIL